MSTLPDSILELSNKIQDDISMDESGTYLANKDIVHKYLPEDITPEVYDSVKVYDANFIEASIHATGVKAAEYFRETPSAEIATSSFILSDNITSDVQITKEDGILQTHAATLVTLTNFETVRKNIADFVLEEEEA